MNCEMCGKTSELREVKVEQSIMNVCNECGKFGREIIQPRYKKHKKFIEEKEEDLISDFEQIIKRKRQELGMSQEEFAKKLNEKESVIKHVEQGKKPTLNIAKKIERMLGIKLIEVIEDNFSINRSKDETFTLGDMIKIKKR